MDFETFAKGCPSRKLHMFKASTNKEFSKCKLTAFKQDMDENHIPPKSVMVYAKCVESNCPFWYTLEWAGKHIVTAIKEVKVGL